MFFDVFLYSDEIFCRFDGRVMLERLRGKRVVFVGDSLNRNMWESLVCALREALADKSRVVEVSGRRKLRTRGFFSFLFRVFILCTNIVLLIVLNYLELDFLLCRIISAQLILSSPHSWFKNGRYLPKLEREEKL